MADPPGSPFDMLLRREPVRAWLDRFRAVQLRTLALVGLLLAGAAAAASGLVSVLIPDADLDPLADWKKVAFVLAFFAAVGFIVVASTTLMKRKLAIKQPVLAAIAAARRMTYRAEAGEAPVGDEAMALLLGHWAGSRKFFEDVFEGRLEDEAGFTIFEVTQILGGGRYADLVFRGTVHGYGRRGPEAQTMVWSPRGFLHGPQPQGPVPRVAIGDPDLDRAFHVFATDPAEAQRLLAGTPLASFLLEQRRRGRVNAYIGPWLAMVAVQGRNRFEVGRLLGWRGGRERVRRMDEQVAQSEALLRRFRDLVG